MILQLDSRVSDCIACRDVYFYLQLASGRNSRMPITLSRDTRWKNCRPVSQLLFTTSLRYRTILSFSPLQDACDCDYMDVGVEAHHEK